MDHEPLPAPPTAQPPLDLDDLPRSSWPKVLGVLSLIYALGGLTCTCLFTGGMAFAGFIPKEFTGGVTYPPAFRIVHGTTALVGFILGVVMLVGSINLLRRRRSGPRLLRMWVILRLLLIIVALSLAIPMLPIDVQMARQSEAHIEEVRREHGDGWWLPDTSTQTDDQIARSSFRNGAIASAAFAAYPVFLGFFLTRRRIEDEVARWS
jgi:hypothetical protein